MDRPCGRERPLSQSPLYCFICFPTLSLPFCVALVPNHRVRLPVWPTPQPIKAVVLEIVIESRDRAHLVSTIDALKTAGIQVEVLS